MAEIGSTILVPRYVEGHMHFNVNGVIIAMQTAYLLKFVNTIDLGTCIKCHVASALVII